MIKSIRSQRGLDMLSSDFIRNVKTHDWEGWEQKELSDILPCCAQNDEEITKAYSIIKEIIKRQTGLSLFDTQLMAAYAMQQGHIAELPTGEGKTLSAVVTASILALQEKHVHILVFNDYLAHRDYQSNLSIYNACGLTCGYIEASSDIAKRKKAYACDVVYISAKEAAFDYLRDFLCMEKEQLLFPVFSVVLVDEADSILIDEARIPLILAGNTDSRLSITATISRVVSELEESDYEVNPSDHQVWLTELGIDTIEEKLQVENLFLPENAEILAMVNAALEARFLIKKDKDYVVRDNSISIIDESTGRVVQNRRFPDLLHQAVEMQETGTQNAPMMIYNSMSMQAFLSHYQMLCGMTGTAASSAAEFKSMYDLEVVVIPPHTPCIRKDHPDEIFLDKEEQEGAILSLIRSIHVKGQPILIGTQSVQESEHFSGLLTKQGVKHCILNARNDAEEVEIIAEAGKPHQITISTNMAGRGVDIKLGGSDECQADFVRSAGGLFVIGTGINRSIRIDNQLRGRAGRQGDPGESQFFVCLNDLKMETFFEIEFYHYTKYPKLLRQTQKIQEGRDAEARYMLERYSRILEDQRRQVTEYRTQILLGQKVPEIMQKEAPVSYCTLVKKAGNQGVTIAEKQLTLHFINTNWASYLAAMEDMRTSIHLMVLGKKNPLDEYYLFAGAAFREMAEDIKCDVVKHMQECTITDQGIDMEAAGLIGPATTWTYMIDESTSQFSRIPHLIKSMSTTIQETRRMFLEFLSRLRGFQALYFYLHYRNTARMEVIMKKHLLYQNDYKLPYADFINQVKRTKVEDISDLELVTLLKRKLQEQEQKEQERKFSIIKELIRRIKGLTLYDTQLSGAYSLLCGNIAELAAGEGKSIAAVVSAIYFAFNGHKVHILVLNDYLAKRDYDSNHEIYEKCGLRVGYINKKTSIEQRRVVYKCDIVYVPFMEAGFDYLRNFIAAVDDDLVFPTFDVVIVDDADTIMIDYANTSLVLSGEIQQHNNLAAEIDCCINKLNPEDIAMDTFEHQVWLTETGVAHIESLLDIKNLYNENNINVLSCIHNALEAYYLLKKNEDYIVKDSAVYKVKSTSSQVHGNNKFTDLLQRALEAKEGVLHTSQTIIYNAQTVQDFLLQYPMMCGMSGTIATSADEIKDSYGLEVDVICSQTPCIRIDHPDIISSNMSEHSEAVVEQIQFTHNTKQPIIVVTRNAVESQELSVLLSEIEISHEIVNARNAEDEAAIITQAGMPGSVTIITYITGRGIGIKLGGGNERYREDVIESGGLYIIGTGINSSVRIDNQLRGRAGRQGDPGESCFFICLDNEELLCRMSGIQRLLAVSKKDYAKQNIARRVQRQIEIEAAETRRLLRKYACVLEQQRCSVSKWRSDLLSKKLYMSYLESADPHIYEILCAESGIKAVHDTERQLALYYINRHWADHLALMEDTRENIYFLFRKKMDPYIEYCRLANNYYEKFQENVKNSVVSSMIKFPAIKDNLEMYGVELSESTSSWAYAVDDPYDQPNSSHMVLRKVKESITGEDGAYTKQCKLQGKNICPRAFR